MQEHMKIDGVLLVYWEHRDIFNIYCNQFISFLQAHWDTFLIMYYFETDFLPIYCFPNSDKWMPYFTIMLANLDWHQDILLDLLFCNEIWWFSKKYNRVSFKNFQYAVSFDLNEVRIKTTLEPHPNIHSSTLKSVNDINTCNIDLKQLILKYYKPYKGITCPLV